MIPLILGVLCTTTISPFSLAYFAILYLAWTKKNFFYILNYVNIIVMVLCLSEYVFLFIMDTKLLTINQSNEIYLESLYIQL